MAAPLCIVGLGEAVYDVFPDKVVLGGTSLNVSVHAHQLLAPLGGRGVLLSRVGVDDLGRRLRDEFHSRELPTEFIQSDPDKPTGKVIVQFRNGAPEYEIVVDSAWDNLTCGARELDLARSCGAVSFGSLSQRHPTARAALRTFLSTAKSATRIFDVNLRMDIYTAEMLDYGCSAAHWVKLNETELPVVSRLLGIAGNSTDALATALRARYKLEAVIHTRGERGTAAYTSDGRIECEPVHYPSAPGADSVGAGDACCAGLLTGRLFGLNWPDIIHLANHLGAYVASQPSATPPLSAPFHSFIRKLIEGGKPHV